MASDNRIFGGLEQLWITGVNDISHAYDAQRKRCALDPHLTEQETSQMAHSWKYQDTSMDLADASLVVIAETRQLRRVFALTATSASTPRTINKRSKSFLKNFRRSCKVFGAAALRPTGGDRSIWPKVRERFCSTYQIRVREDALLGFKASHFI